MIKAFLQTSSPVQGMLVAALTFLLLSVMQVFAKLLGEAGYHPVEVTFYRNAIGFLIVLGWLLARKRAALMKTKRPRAHISRAVIGTTGFVLNIAAFQLMPLSETTIFLFSSSLIMPVLAVVFLKDKVGVYRWLSIVVGFCGVALIAQPSGQVSLIGVVCALSGATTTAIVGINLRYLGRTEHPLTVVFFFLMIGALLAGAAMPFFAHAPKMTDLWMIAGIAASGTAAQILLSLAYKLAPPALVAPLNYTGLIWALLFDMLIWSYVPGWPVFFGGAVVIASNLFILHREQAAQRRAKAETALVD